MTITLYHGDCLDLLPTLEENSVDTVVTDPPYGLSKEPDIAEVMRAWLDDKPYTHTGGGFMGRSWDSFVPGPRYWREAYRVLKPGGTLLCFASTRTFDLMGIAIRFAGFEMHPFVGWIFGSGFPKATSVSKHLDRVAGVEREVVGKRTDRAATPKRDFRGGKFHAGAEHKNIDLSDITAPATPTAQLWDGWYYGKQALKPAIEPILMAQKPMDGTGFNNALTWGVAGLNIDGCRVAAEQSYIENGIRIASQDAETCFGQAKGQDENWHKFPGNAKGRWPANLLLSHNPDVPCFCSGDWSDCPYCSGTGIVPGCRRVGARRVKGAGWKDTDTDRPFQAMHEGRWKVRKAGHYTDPDGLKTVDAWECSEGCAVDLLARQSGDCGGKWGRQGKSQPRSMFFGEHAEGIAERSEAYIGDTGTAARFFQHCDWGEDDVRFWYQAKASKSERNQGCEDLYWRKDKAVPFRFVQVTEDEWENLPEKQQAQGNVHSTVKPLSLLRYLVRLTRIPTGGVVLDPFMGSGSTGVACVLENRSFIGIEKDAESFEISQRRIAYAQNEM